MINTLLSAAARFSVKIPMKM